MKDNLIIFILLIITFVLGYIAYHFQDIMNDAVETAMVEYLELNGYYVTE